MEPPAQAEAAENINQIKKIYGFVRNVSWFISAYIALAVFFLVKKFAFDIVRVNNKDMQDTYHYGDALLIKKSFNRYNTGDVVYMQYPAPDSVLSKTYFFQRIYGLPGDSVELKEKLVYINGMQILDTSSLKHNYFIKAVQKLDTNLRMTYSLTEGGLVSDELDYSYSLTREQSEQVKQEPYVASVTLKTEKRYNYDETCFPGTPIFKWNMDHYGKLYIPKVNDTLRLDTLNLKLYGIIITEHEKNQLELHGDSILINGQYCNSYVVKKNYYWVLGDNRDNANDSRAWGYLPENLILGKVIKLIRRSK
jgi:signal peptidase I